MVIISLYFLLPSRYLQTDRRVRKGTRELEVNGAVKTKKIKSADRLPFTVCLLLQKVPLCPLVNRVCSVCLPPRQKWLLRMGQRSVSCAFGVAWTTEQKHSPSQSPQLQPDCCPGLMSELPEILVWGRSSTTAARGYHAKCILWSRLVPEEEHR